MNENYTKLRDSALEHRDDSCENGNDNDVYYWSGYLDGLDALYKKLYATEEALGKQTPKKPYFGKVWGFKGISGYLCPICRNWLLYPDEIPTICDSFCPRCGQRIDWSEVDE